MPYPRFAKAIIQHFISKDKSISMRNRIFMHSIKNDSVLGILKFVPKDEAYQVYGKTIASVMINQEIKNSTAYQTYLAYSTGATNPKKARKWKQPTSALKKESYLTSDDNIIFDDPKRLVSKKSNRKRKPTSIIIKDTLGVLKKKTSVQAQKHKGMELLSNATSLEEAQTRKALKISRRENSFRHQTGGSSKGVGSKPEVPDDPKGKSIHISEGSVSKSDQENELVHTPDDYVPTDDETRNVDDEEYDRINEEMYNDVNVELKDAELADKGKGDKEMTNGEKVNAEHEEAKQEVASAQVQYEAQATTTTAPATQKEKTDVQPSSSSQSVSSNYGSIFLNLDNISSAALNGIDQKQALFKTMGASKSFNNHPKHMALYHVLMESILTDEDAMAQGADEQKKRKPVDDNRDEEPPVGPVHGLKRRKTSKDVELCKRKKSINSSKETTRSQPKSTSKFAQAEETVFEATDTDIPRNQGDGTGKQTSVEAALKKDWFKIRKRPLTPDPEWNQGRQNILAHYFFNNDLKYLRGGGTDKKYTTSITKANAAKYELNGIEDMVPTLWSPIKKRVEDLQLGVEANKRSSTSLSPEHMMKNSHGLQSAWGTRLKFSMAFHPEIDGQIERTIHTLEDMLRSCALEWTRNSDEYLCLVEFSYNNSWHDSIKAAPYELLYGRKCRAPICWNEVGEHVIEGLELIDVTNETVAVAKEKLKEARSRQKSHADRHRRSLEFNPRDHVFLKVSSCRGVRSFGIKRKLSPRFIGPFEILYCVGEVSNRLALPSQLSYVHNVFHVSLLRGYKYHPLHVVSYPLDKICKDLSLIEEPEKILDRQERVMRNKTISFVKILWKNHPKREATWET
uniref:Putative nucleotidyltransferase, ribonuclease H n=1 Tax=Tanacetum cinerariifolium TaxID=118510 RepID=A0A6L2KWA9_TANCI|nr:putative nucleotidyltransferase, ribonuclease H [Tanacetum cinerariifolium]